MSDPIDPDTVWTLDGYRSHWDRIGTEFDTLPVLAAMAADGIEVTDWERQEIERTTDNLVRQATDAIERIKAQVDRALTGQGGHDSIGWNNAAGRLADAAHAAALLAGRIDGAHHRHHMNNRPTD